MINERLGDLSKTLQDPLNENTNIKSWSAVAENTSSLLKSNTEKLNEQLINIEHCQYSLEQYYTRESIEF